jgi:hypothetical protein
MLTGQGLIGKLALFVAEKLLGHRLALSLDEKKRACRAFVEFYHCLDRLEELNGRSVALLNFGVKHGGILVGDLQLLMPSVSTTSQRFLEIRGELHHALALIDPSLANTVRQIYEAKGSFLQELSGGITIEESSDDALSVRYFEPDSRILKIDMSAYERWVVQSSGSASYEPAALEWPQSLLWHGEFEEGFHPAQLLLTDAKSLGNLRDILVDHGSVLSAAREKMRDFIASKFTTEDILYVSRGMPRDDF